MALEITCECGRQFHVGEQFAGKMGRCPSCGKVMPIEAAPPVAPPAPGLPEQAKHAEKRSDEGAEDLAAAPTAGPVKLAAIALFCLAAIALAAWYLFFRQTGGRPHQSATPNHSTPSPPAKVTSAQPRGPASSDSAGPRIPPLADGPWQTNSDALRVVLARRLAAYVPVSPKAAAPVEAEAQRAIQPLVGRNVSWMIVFTGSSRTGAVQFARHDAAGAALSEPARLVSLNLRPSAASAAQWSKLAPNTLVRCSARIRSIALSSRWSASGAFAGWQPIVDLEAADPEPLAGGPSGL